MKNFFSLNDDGGSLSTLRIKIIKMLDKLRTLNLIERIALFNKLKNENSLEYKKILDLPLNDRIKLFTPPHQSRLTGYMLFLRSKNLSLNDGSRIWASFTNDQRRVC